MTCGPNRSKPSCHTFESTESSPPSWPCCARQLRSGNCQLRISVNGAMPSASGASGPAIPSSDTDIVSTTLVISCSSSDGGRLLRPLTRESERARTSLHHGHEHDPAEHLSGFHLLMSQHGLLQRQQLVPVSIS